MPCLRMIATAMMLWFVPAGVYADDAAPAAVATVQSWEMDRTASHLRFAFVQAGSDESGAFDAFEAVFSFDPERLADSRFEVTVQLGSVNTGDKERDGILRSADMFGTGKWPQARFVATAIRAQGDDRYLADAELTLRDTTRPLAFPFTLRIDTSGGQRRFHLQADVVLHRLEYGVGQGDWKSTTWIDDEVAVHADVWANAAPR